MMKWFRKYNRQLMAGLVVFLMVAFLVQDSLSNRGNNRRGSEVWGKFHGQEVRTDLKERAGLVQLLLNEVGISWSEPWSMLLPQQYARYATMLFGFKPLSAEQYAVLRMDAIESGVDISEETVSDYIARLPANLLGAVRQRHGVSVAQISEAIRDHLRVVSRAELMLGLVQVTDNEVRRQLRDTQDRVEIAYVAFPADAFVDPALAPTDAEIEAQYQKYRDVEASTNGAGYSYRWPPRVLIETASVHVADVEKSVTVTEEQARAYYRQNKSRYTRPKPPSSQPEPSASQPGSASAPAVDVQSFREVRGDIEREVRRRAAQSRAREIVEQVASEAGRPWDLQKRGKDGYAERPAGVNAPGYLDGVAQPFARRAGLTVTVERSGLISLDDLQHKLPWKRIRPASEQTAGQLPLAEAAFRVPGSFDAAKIGETEARLALFQPSSTVYAEFNDAGEPVRYIAFRPIEWQPAQPPAALAEVRERVVKDLRRAAAMKKAGEMAQRLYVPAMQSGLKVALDHDPELHDLLSKAPAADDDTNAPLPAGEPYHSAGPFARRSLSFFGGEGPATVPGLGASEKLIDGVFEMTADNFVSPPAAAAVATQPAAAATQPSPKVRVLELPESRQFVVIELRKHDPVRQDQFKAADANVRQQIMMMRRVDLLKRWFDPETLFKRLGFEPAHPTTMEPASEG